MKVTCEICEVEQQETPPGVLWLDIFYIRKCECEREIHFCGSCTSKIGICKSCKRENKINSILA
jgi:hypothetical protein